MRIKHFAGYGTVEALKIPNKSCALHVRVTGNHERGIRRDDLYDLFSWLIKRFDRSMKDVTYAEFHRMNPKVYIVEWNDHSEVGVKDTCDYYFDYRK